MKNQIYDAFESVHAEEQLKEKTKDFLLRQMAAQSQNRGRRIRYLVSVACCLLAFFGFAGYRFYAEPVAVVSVDVNPSVELGVNRLGRVVSVTSYNEDAQNVTQGLKLRHMKYEDAVRVLLEEETEYITEEELISVSVLSDDAEMCASMQEQIASCTNQQYVNVECHGDNMEYVQPAHEAGLSCGKYRAFLELQAVDPTATVEEVKDLTMREIQDRIQECEGEGVTEEDISPNGQDDTGACQGGDAGKATGQGQGTGHCQDGSAKEPGGGDTGQSSSGNGNSGAEGNETSSGNGAGGGNGNGEETCSGNEGAGSNGHHGGKHRQHE